MTVDVDPTGIRLRRTGLGLDPALLLGVALRRNPRRAHLLVSRVLGKHVPTEPRLVRAAGLLLGGLAGDAVDGAVPRALPQPRLAAAVGGDASAAAGLHATVLPAPEGPRDVLVLGFAETATALGHCVAEALGADYLHSTRRPVAGFAPAGAFVEEHSHATDHLLLPADPALLHGRRPLVLVDDELSTGRTALNTITALHRLAPRERYVLAALVDLRPPGGELAERVRALGAHLDVVALARGAVHLSADLATRVPAGALPEPLVGAPRPVPRVDLRELGWPAELPAGGRHGVTGAQHRALAAALPGLAAGVARAAQLRRDERVLVLGTEELMHLPLRIAQTLADQGHRVAFSTTTRSPAAVVDADGYALRSGLAFPAHDDPPDGPGTRYAYNLGTPDSEPWDHTLVVVDPPADTPGLHTGLLAALAPRARRTTLVVTP